MAHSESTPSATSATVDIDHLKTWIGRLDESSGLVTPSLVAAFRATLDQDPGELAAGEPAPVAIHWCLAAPTSPMSALGPDGHPARGGFLPPVPLPRRMWAGGRLVFEDPLRIGDTVTRRSRVLSVDLKHGRTGPLVFVVVEHALSTERGLAIREEQDIVYREAEAPGAPKAPPSRAPASPAPVEAEASRTIVPSPVLLFRYSALTFNGHRIHYDRSYVTEVEGYPGLIVHGPLQATLLLTLATEVLGRPLRRFSFRSERPLFDLAPFTIAGDREADGARLRVLDAQGAVTMKAEAG